MMGNYDVSAGLLSSMCYSGNRKCRGLQNQLVLNIKFDPLNVLLFLLLVLIGKGIVSVSASPQLRFLRLESTCGFSVRTLINTSTKEP